MNENNYARGGALRSPWLFFAVTFALTWLFWLVAAGLGLGMDSAAGGLLLALGIMGPMVSGIGFTYLTRDQAGRRDYWKRITDFKRFGFVWYLIVFLLVPLLSGMAALIDVLLGGRGAVWGEVILNFASDPWAILPSVLFSSIIPFFEELGWRGYVLDRMQAKWSALRAGLILGGIWSIWHLPLFFIKGSYQNGLGVGTPAFWLFMAGLVPLTVVFSWIFNNTNRSTLAVFLFHSMVNFTGELIAVTERADTLLIGLWFVAAAVVCFIWGPRTLAGRRAGGLLAASSGAAGS